MAYKVYMYMCINFGSGSTINRAVYECAHRYCFGVSHAKIANLTTAKFNHMP